MKAKILFYKNQKMRWTVKINRKHGNESKPKLTYQVLLNYQDFVVWDLKDHSLSAQVELFPPYKYLLDQLQISVEYKVIKLCVPRFSNWVIFSGIVPVRPFNPKFRIRNVES
jgi:hypothetical protein